MPPYIYTSPKTFWLKTLQNTWRHYQAGDSSRPYLASSSAWGRDSAVGSAKFPREHALERSRPKQEILALPSPRRTG